MTTGDPEPQIEQVRELIVTGKLEQFKGLMELEAGPPIDDIFKLGRRVKLTLFGLIAHDSSARWLVYNGSHPVLGRLRRGSISFGSGPWQFSASPGMTVQQIYDQIAESGLDPCGILHLGSLHAIELPEDRLRLLFAVARFEHPPLFWRWVDDLTVELHRLGFLACPQPLAGGRHAGPSGAPPLDDTRRGQRRHILPDLLLPNPELPGDVRWCPQPAIIVHHPGQQQVDKRTVLPVGQPADHRVIQRLRVQLHPCSHRCSRTQ